MTAREEVLHLLSGSPEHKLLQVLAHIAGVNQTIDVHVFLLFVFHVYPS